MLDLRLILVVDYLKHCAIVMVLHLLILASLILRLLRKSLTQFVTLRRRFNSSKLCFAIKTLLFKKTRSSCYIPVDSYHREKLGIHVNICLPKMSVYKSRHTYALNKCQSLILLL